MSQRIIHIFISHSWNYHRHYDTLQSWIVAGWSSGSARISFRDYSVPRNDPIHTTGTDRDLQRRIFARISHSHVVIIPMGMYASYSKWIRKEIDGANVYGKPKLAIKPWGQERVASVVRNAADEVVGWNREVFVRKIWQLYRDQQ